MSDPLVNPASLVSPASRPAVLRENDSDAQQPINHDSDPTIKFLLSQVALLKSELDAINARLSRASGSGTVTCNNDGTATIKLSLNV